MPASSFCFCFQRLLCEDLDPRRLRGPSPEIPGCSAERVTSLPDAAWAWPGLVPHHSLGVLGAALRGSATSAVTLRGGRCDTAVWCEQPWLSARSWARGAPPSTPSPALPRGSRAGVAAHHAGLAHSPGKAPLLPRPTWPLPRPHRATPNMAAAAPCLAQDGRLPASKMAARRALSHIQDARRSSPFRAVTSLPRAGSGRSSVVTPRLRPGVPGSAAARQSWRRARPGWPWRTRWRR